MTGTGTQEDPFVVDNWTDFVTAVGTTDAYVEFPPTPGVIDLNNESFSTLSTVTIACSQINGNGWTLQNLYTINSSGFYLVHNCVINNLNFLNILANFSNNRIYFFDNSDSSNQYTFNHCKFNGFLNGSNSDACLFRISYSYSRALLNRCSLHMKWNGAVRITNGGGSWKHNSNVDNYCRIKVQGNSTYALVDSHTYVNCKFEGTSASTGINFRDGSAYNVCDVDFSTAASFSCSAPSGSISLINSSKLPAGATIGTGFAGCTNAQMKDPTYIESVGFPIVT